MYECADLEIRIERVGSDTFITRMQLQLPRSEVEIDLKLEEAVKLVFDLQALGTAPTDIAYGTVLGLVLFGNAGVRTLFEQARSAADTLDKPFRLRLAIASSAQDLHLLSWERLVYPGKNSPLFAEPRFLFSRYIDSSSFRPVYLRRREDLRALVVVSSPTDVGDFGVVPLDAAAELDAVRGELHPVPVETLKQGKRATLKEIARSWWSASTCCTWSVTEPPVRVGRGCFWKVRTERPSSLLAMRSRGSFAISSTRPDWL